MSEHGYGTAIDISSINGVDVEQYWGKQSREAKTLDSFYRAACDLFSNVITPDSDARHKDHLHLDSGLGVNCLFH